MSEKLKLKIDVYKKDSHYVVAEPFEITYELGVLKNGETITVKHLRNDSKHFEELLRLGHIVAAK